MQGISNTNLILDTRQYEVRLNYGEINKLNTNVIDDAIYAHCNEDGNAYVILEYIFDLVKEKNSFTEGSEGILQWKDLPKS